MAKIAVLGYGTVGSGVVEVIDTNKESIAKKTGEEICVKHVLDLRDFPNDPVQEKITHNFEDILNDPEVSVVVEVMGGVNPAYDFSKRAILAKKSVCTSNKELVAQHGLELLQLAKEQGVNYLFEASCGGGIPIIRPLNSSLTADVMDEITGILNGTTNYILSKMTAEDLDFATVLADAQERGYAERNPEADVEGHDPARKIAILSSLAYGHHVDYKDIYTEGITKISPFDIKYASKLGYVIKLLATSKRTKEGIFTMVCPAFVGTNSPLYSVNDVYNAIFVHGNVLGDAMFYGSGAGKLPTASAVVADVIDCVKNTGKNIMMSWSEDKLELMDVKKVDSRFFVRKEGSLTASLSDVEAIFGEVTPVGLTDAAEEFGFVTPHMTEEVFDQKIKELGGCIQRIRIKD